MFLFLLFISLLKNLLWKEFNLLINKKNLINLLEYISSIFYDYYDYYELLVNYFFVAFRGMVK